MNKGYFDSCRMKNVVENTFTFIFKSKFCMNDFKDPKYSSIEIEFIVGNFFASIHMINTGILK